VSASFSGITYCRAIYEDFAVSIPVFRINGERGPPQ
jgi:hypothetical protein